MRGTLVAEEEFESFIRSLATRLGLEDVEPGDEHARWRVYQEIAGDAESRPQLLHAVRHEPEGAVASALVVHMLEKVDAEDRKVWVNALPESIRDYAETRARELGMWENLMDRADPSIVDAGSIDGWSDWLQRKIVATATRPEILRLLAEAGRTRAVRRQAKERLNLR